MNAFCTIISPSYLPFAKALQQSLQKNAPGVSFHVLIAGTGELPAATEGMHLNSLHELEGMGLAKDIESKYGKDGDSLRWAIKPVYISFLLQRYSKVIYVDCDIHFAGNAAFLFDELEGHSLLLTPHWADTDPGKNEEEFLMNFRTGLYNAGFIGAGTQAQQTLQWWAQACLFNMSRSPEQGLFDDQRYLDLVTVTDEKVKILRHRGCNLGSWNITSNRRSMSGGKVVINENYPVVFIHFNKETIRQVLNKNDALLQPYLDEYSSRLAASGFDLFKNYSELPAKMYDTSFYAVKHKLRIRTRLKRFFYKLAEKL